MNVSSVMSKLFEIKPELNFQTQHVKVPGKLYISGEYAILEPGHPAILIAVDQYLTSELSMSLKPYQGSISSDLPGMQTLNYRRHRETEAIKLNLEEQSAGSISDWRYVLSAIEVIEDLIHEIGRPVQDYRLNFSSDLASQEGKKYGFGSSGAVTVAAVRSLLQFYGLAAVSPVTIFKLATIALMRLESNGSFGDIAAITLGDWVYYQSFDREWLKARLSKETTILDLLLVEWPYLKLEHVPAVEDLSVLIGWTQSPASTDDLVAYLRQQMDQASNIAPYKSFLDKSQESVERMYQAFKAQEIPAIQEELANYRHLLLKLSKHFNLTIETPALSQLVNLSQAYQFEAKSSGAGGGDCGIAIGHKNQKSQLLIDQWQENGIQALNISVAPLQM